MLFLWLMMIFQGLSLPCLKYEGRKATGFIFLMVGSTIFCVFTSTLVSWVRPKLIHLIMPLNLLVRGILVIFVAPKIYSGRTCAPMTYPLITSGLCLVLFMSEISLFYRSRLSFFLFLVTGIIDIIAKYRNPNLLPFCEVNKSRYAFAVFIGVLYMVPVYASSYLNSVSDLKAFLLS